MEPLRDIGSRRMHLRIIVDPQANLQAPCMSTPFSRPGCDHPMLVSRRHRHRSTQHV